MIFSKKLIAVMISSRIITGAFFILVAASVVSTAGVPQKPYNLIPSNSPFTKKVGYVSNAGYRKHEAAKNRAVTRKPSSLSVKRSLQYGCYCAVFGDIQIGGGRLITIICTCQNDYTCIASVVVCSESVSIEISGDCV